MPASNSGYLRALPLANGVLIATSLYSLGWCLFSILQHKQQLYLKAGPAVIALCACLALRLRPAVRMMAMSLVIGAGAGIYGTELAAMVLINPDRALQEAVRTEAQQHGLLFDGRPKIDVIMDLRRRGVSAYPPFYPYLTFAALLEVNGVPILPIGSVSRIVTVACNEGGQWLTYPTDEYGFPNPPGLWKQAPVDIALVGASVATGECVPTADSVAHQLRERYPKTVAVSAGGNGPLLELASIREYLPALRPARVLWIVSESHPSALQKEQQVAALSRYLDDSYEQGLITRQPDIDRAVRAYLEDATQAELHPQGPSVRTGMRELLTLKQVRIGVFDLGERVRGPDTVGLDADLYQRVLRRGQEIVAGWGGKIELIYVPDPGRYPGGYGYSPARRRSCEKTKAKVQFVAASLGIPIIDISRSFPDLPISQAAQYNQYFYPYFAHFKPAGYRVMGRAILEQLR